MNLQDRLKKYIQDKRMSVRDFEALCKLGNGTAAALSDNTRRQTFKRIADNCDLNINWLITGKGEMINPNFVPIPEPEIKAPDSVLIPTAVFNIIKQQADILKEQSESLKTQSESLKTRDELLSRMVSLLEAERADRATAKPQPTQA